jgi:hypothetical protein
LLPSDALAASTRAGPVFSDEEGPEEKKKRRGARMITLCIRYTLDANKRRDFERYARKLTEVIPRCGGDLVGYYLPTKLAGPTNFGLALIGFPDLASYETYRERLMKDAEAAENLRLADESGCILIEDRAFLERVRA